MKKICLGLLCLSLYACNKKDTPANQLVYDADNNSYTTVTIGNQTWLAQNFKGTKDKKGNTIPNIKDPVDWFNKTTAARCYYGNDSTTNVKNGNGVLYNQYALDTLQLPYGYRFADTADYCTLIKTLGGDPNAVGGVLKTGNFKGLLSGWRYYGGDFRNIDTLGIFWSTTPLYSYTLYSGNQKIEQGTNAQNCGFSVRLIKN